MLTSRIFWKKGLGAARVTLCASNWWPSSQVFIFPQIFKGSFNVFLDVVPLEAQLFWHVFQKSPLLTEVAAKYCYFAKFRWRQVFFYISSFLVLDDSGGRLSAVAGAISNCEHQGEILDAANTLLFYNLYCKSSLVKTLFVHGVLFSICSYNSSPRLSINMSL